MKNSSFYSVELGNMISDHDDVSNPPLSFYFQKN